MAAAAAVSEAAVAVAAVSGGAGAEVAGVAAAAQAGERAACAKLHDLADKRQNLTSCRAGISARRVGDDFPRR